MTHWIAGLALAGCLMAGPAFAGPGEANHRTANLPQKEMEPTSPARLLADSLAAEEPRLLVEEILGRNPALAAAEARVEAARRRTPQVRALPDPVVGATLFLSEPETRVGPQRLMLSLSQGLPWAGKLSLKEQAALLEASALDAEVEAERLRLVTEVRRLLLELSFLEEYRQISRAFRLHLEQHEEIARARYASGSGSGQGVIKLQAEITRVDARLLEIERRRSSQLAELNRLRDRPAAEPVEQPALEEVEEVQPVIEELLAEARRLRPELAAAAARIARGEALIELAEKGRRPDFQVGLTYTLVDGRRDEPGRPVPPPDNGDDILGIQGGVSLPVWRSKLGAAVEEAASLRTAAREGEREILARIEAAVGDLAQRLPLDWQRLRLLEDLLLLQAEEALDSARAGYVAGTLNALDLLDAEHVLYETRTAVARTRADYLLQLARLEGEIGRPLEPSRRQESDR
jgi:outer membrane protein TolC